MIACSLSPPRGAWPRNLSPPARIVSLDWANPPAHGLSGRHRLSPPGWPAGFLLGWVAGWPQAV